MNGKSCHAGSFGIGYSNGGPVSIIWGWIICSGMSFCVAACMAEITSSLPISGGPYYWCAFLAILPFAEVVDALPTHSRHTPTNKVCSDCASHRGACPSKVTVTRFFPTACQSQSAMRSKLLTLCRSVELAKDTYLSSAFAGWITGLCAATPAA